MPLLGARKSSAYPLLEFSYQVESQMRTLRCPDCNGEMEEGFVPDFSDGQVKQTFWHPGKPEGQTFFGMKGVDPSIKYELNKMVPITTYRCKKCHVLRAYANS
jgi:hypothetical protein